MWPPDSHLPCLSVHSRSGLSAFWTGINWEVCSQRLMDSLVSLQESLQLVLCEPGRKTSCEGIRCSAGSIWSTALFLPVLTALYGHSLRELHLGNWQEKMPPCLSFYACFPHLLSSEMNVKCKELLHPHLCVAISGVQRLIVYLSVSKLLFDINSLWIKSWKNVKEDTLTLLQLLNSSSNLTPNRSVVPTFCP